MISSSKVLVVTITKMSRMRRLAEDNISVTRAHYKMTRSVSNKVSTLDWPTGPQKLCIIENVFFEVAYKAHVYARKFNNFGKLENSVLDCWESVDSVYFRSLCLSIPHRLVFDTDQKPIWSTISYVNEFMCLHLCVFFKWHSKIFSRIV